jgi:beta-glucosidase
VKIEYFEGGVGAVAKFVWMPPSTGENRFAEAVDGAKRADAIVMVLGISSKLEGEEMNVTEAGFKGGDRTSIDLPERQQRLLEAVAATGKPIVVVLLSGSALRQRAADHRTRFSGCIRRRRWHGCADAWRLQPGGPTARDVLQIARPVAAVRELRDGRADLPFGRAVYPFGFGLSTPSSHTRSRHPRQWPPAPRLS